MKLLRRKPFLGIREKMILCCILSTIITIVFSDLVVYWIYQKDITEKEFFYMEDGNQILSDNIDNLISTIEEKLVTELEYCTVFSYQDDHTDENARYQCEEYLYSGSVYLQLLL